MEQALACSLSISHRLVRERRPGTKAPIAGKAGIGVARPLPDVHGSARGIICREVGASDGAKLSRDRQGAVVKSSGQPFWQDESYDRWVRTATEVDRVVRYIERNPVAAG